MLTWIRLPKHERYHAVYHQKPEGPVTFCGRSVEPGCIEDESLMPAARCSQCMTRVRLPHLIPNELANLKRPRARF